MKVQGLEQTRRLPDAEIEVTAGELSAARDYFVAAEVRRQQAEPAGGPRGLAVPIRSHPPAVDGKLDDWERPPGRPSTSGRRRSATGAAARF